MLYKVKTPLLYFVQAELDKLNKKADKWGFIPYTIINKTERILEKSSEIGMGYRESWTFFEISGETILKFAGNWQLLGTVEHIEGQSILRSVPGQTIPVEFQNADALRCDHCHKRIIRKLSCILQDNSGNVRQIGRSCVRDYIGYDIDQVIGYFEIISEFENAFKKFDKENEKEPRQFRQVLTEDFLTIACYVVRCAGFVSRKMAENSGNIFLMTTADNVELLMFKDNEPKKFSEEHENKQVDETDKAKAKEILEYLKALPDIRTRGNDYLHNLKVIANLSSILPNHYGFLASAVALYDKEMGNETAKQAAKTSKHYGEKGQCYKGLLIQVKIERVTCKDTEYGTTYIYKMIAQDGARFTWFASSNQGLKEGDINQIIAMTVKDHNIWQGTNETIINRVKFSS